MAASAALATRAVVSKVTGTAPSRSRLWDLYTTQCKIYQHSPNPTGARRGSKILRARLQGPKLATYYPPRVSTMKDLKRMAKPLGGVPMDGDEIYREEMIEERQMRGKGAPKKRRTAEEGRAAKKGKKKAAVDSNKAADPNSIWGRG